MSGTRTETAPLPAPPAPGSPLPTDVPLTVAEPEGTPRGGIVVLHEARGVTDDVLQLARVLADEGWLAVAPHLYHRETGGPAAGRGETEQGDAAEQVASLTGGTVLADCDGAFGWLARRGITPDRTGVIGFDTGGSVALVVAASRALGAAVSISGGGIVDPLSGGLPALVDVAPALGCPWLGLYGQDDPTIPAEQVEALRRAAATSDVATNVVTYAGVGHRVGERPPVVDGGDPVPTDALPRLLGWFDSHLR